MLLLWYNKGRKDMRRCHCNCGDGFGLFLLAILPIILFVWIFKLIIKGIAGLVALGTASAQTLKSSKSSSGSIIPSADDIDRYEEYDAIFNDED